MGTLGRQAHQVLVRPRCGRFFAFRPAASTLAEMRGAEDVSGSSLAILVVSRS